MAENHPHSAHDDDGSIACPHCDGTGRLWNLLSSAALGGAAALFRQCVLLDIEVIDGHVAERDAARLLGRSRHTLKRRRLTDRPIEPLKYLGRTRYRLDDIAQFKAASTRADE